MTVAGLSLRARRPASLVVVALIVVLGVVAGAGSAQAAKRRVGLSLSGPHASAVHGAIAAALKRHGFVTISTGLAGDSPDAVAKAARQGNLSAVIVGDIHDSGKHLKLRVYGATGDLIGSGAWAESAGIKTLAKVLKRTLWAEVGAGLSKARPAPAQGQRGAKEEGQEPPPAAGRAGTSSSPSSNNASNSASSNAPRKPSTAKGEAEAENNESADEKEEAEEAAARRKSKKKRAAESEEAEEAAEPEEPPGGAGTALDLAIGPRFVSRDLTWKPPVAGVRPYSLGLAPGIGASVAWYPAARSRGGWISNLGLAGAFEYLPGLTSSTSDGLSFPTTASDFWGGLRARMILHKLEGALTLGAGRQGFIFYSKGASMRDSLGTNPYLPDVAYTYGRVGLDARVALPAKLALMLGAGYRYVFSAGKDNYLIQQSEYFPSSTFVAFDVTAAAGYRVLPYLEARAGFDLRRYQMTAGTNTYMVTGATDQYVALWAQLAFMLDGYAAGAGGGQ